MSTNAKQRIAGIILLASAVCMVVCIWRMLPYGLAGEVGKVKAYATGMFAAFIVSLPAGLAYYYYRSSVRNEVADKDLERLRIETTVLADMGRTSEAPKSPQPDSKKDLQK